MNIIQQQATDWMRFRFDPAGEYKEFIDNARSQLYEYRKPSHKLEFVDEIMRILKVQYDEHLKVCPHPNDSSKCYFNKNFENALFFLQNERDDILDNLPASDFSIQDRNIVNENFKNILDDLKLIQVGQEITYDDLKKELDELKEFYFLNKKHWSQLLIGRLSEMVASGVISETISKDIVEAVTKNYESLFN